jgi:hypothetical protein
MLQSMQHKSASVAIAKVALGPKPPLVPPPFLQGPPSPQKPPSPTPWKHNPPRWKGLPPCKPASLHGPPSPPWKGFPPSTTAPLKGVPPEVKPKPTVELAVAGAQPLPVPPTPRMPQQCKTPMPQTLKTYLEKGMRPKGPQPSEQHT